MSKTKKTHFADETLCPINVEENSQFDREHFNNKLPTKIEDTYKDDYDIMYVHNIILNTIKQEKFTLPNLYKQLNALNQSLLTLQTYNVKKDTLKNRDDLEDHIKNINNNTKLIEYQKASEPLITQYTLLKKNNQERLKVIQQYLKLAKKYIVIHVTRVIDAKIVCLNCKATLEEVSNGNGAIRCIGCNNEYQAINATKYTDNYNMQYINTDNDDENFAKALMRYQGLQNTPPKIIFEKLNVYFKQRGFPDAETIRAMPYNDQGKKGNTNKKMLCTALASVGYASFYEDSSLIGAILFDWKLPDLTHLKDTILEHYAITQKSFYKIPSNVRQRISSLGTQYRLWRHLQLVGHQCCVEDFKIAENNDSLQNHHRLWRMMVEISNHPDIYYID